MNQANTAQLPGMPLGLKEAAIQISVRIELPTLQHEDCMQAYNVSGLDVYIFHQRDPASH